MAREKTKPRSDPTPPGGRILYVPISAELNGRLDAQLARTRRSIAEEVRVALERHLDAEERLVREGAR
jgi:hypothetical protein